MSKEIKLEAFYGVSSPWAYFGAPQLYEIVQKHSITPIHRPIIIISANGGIPLRTRPDARQAYHEVELARWRKHLDKPLNLKPKYYPLPEGRIQLPAQAIIRAQLRLGDGSSEVREFSYAIQRALWVEERNIGDVETLVEIAMSVGVEREVAERICEDKRDDKEDEGVMGWEANLRDAEALGIFGTPTYVLNGELFWGQDRLPFLDARISELKEQGYTVV